MASSCCSGRAWIRVVVVSFRGAAATVEQAEHDCGFTEGTSTSFAFHAAFLNPLLGNTGVAQVFGVNGCDLHEVLASK